MQLQLAAFRNFCRSFAASVAIAVIITNINIAAPAAITAIAHVCAYAVVGKFIVVAEN